MSTSKVGNTARMQWQGNRNMIRGAGVRGCEAADYSHEASTCEDQELGARGAKAPLAPPVPPLLAVCFANCYILLSAVVCSQ